MIYLTCLKKLVHAKTEADLNTYQFLINNMATKKYADLWEQRKDWALCCRRNSLTRKTNRNNYAEVMMRILKDKICYRTLEYHPTTRPSSNENRFLSTKTFGFHSG